MKQAMADHRYGRNIRYPGRLPVLTEDIGFHRLLLLLPAVMHRHGEAIRREIIPLYYNNF